MLGPIAASSRDAGTAHSRPSAAIVAAAIPAQVPRHPACTAAATPPRASATRIGTQSATRTASTSPGTSATIASPSGRASGSALAAASALTMRIARPCTWRTCMTIESGTPSAAAASGTGSAGATRPAGAAGAADGNGGCATANRCCATSPSGRQRRRRREPSWSQWNAGPTGGGAGSWGGDGVQPGLSVDMTGCPDHRRFTGDFGWHTP